MLLHLKIDSAKPVRKHLQQIFSKLYVWETGKEMSYIILLLPGLRNCFCRATGEAVSGQSATAKLAFSPMRFSVQFVVAE